MQGFDVRTLLFPRVELEPRKGRAWVESPLNRSGFPILGSGAAPAVTGADDSGAGLGGQTDWNWVGGRSGWGKVGEELDDHAELLLLLLDLLLLLLELLMLLVTDLK